MEFIIFIIFVYLAFSHFSLVGRVSRLEKRLPQRESIGRASEELHIENKSQPTQPDSRPFSLYPEITDAYRQNLTPVTSIPRAQLKQVEPAGESFIYAWFREQTLIKVGSIIFFLGAVWFVSYAIEQNWISPLLRIFLGLMLACAIYAVGYWRSSLEQTQYQVLTVLGTGVFLGTVIASQFSFVTPVLPASSAFLLMIISIGYTLFVAFRTKTEWLAIVASVAGLMAPFLVNINESLPILLLTYFFLLSAGFLAVVFITSWRAVSLTLLVGTSIHLSSLHDSPLVTDTTLWFFVVIFSALFCASTAVSVTRTNTPTGFDVSAMAIITLQFIGYAIAIALLPGLALFVAATVTAFIGYSLRIRNANADAVSLFVAVSLIFILVGTAELLDGFVLTIAYALEALAIYLLSLKLATIQRSIFVAAALFLVPIMSGLVDLTSPVWNGGILHPEALGTVSVILTLSFTIIWTMSNPAFQTIDWLRNTAASLIVGWYIFAVSASLVVAGALQPNLDRQFTGTLLLSLIAGVVVTYIIKSVPRDSWRIGALFTLIAPTMSAIILFTHPAWVNGVSHQPFLATSLYYIGLISITVLYWAYAKRGSEKSILESSAYLLVWVTLGYGLLFLNTIWDALLTGDANRVVTSISYTFLIYLIINGLMFARASAAKLAPITVALILPGILLIPSLRFAGWADGVISVDAIGLYVTATVLFLLGTTLRQYGNSLSNEEKAIAQSIGSALYVTAGIMVFMLVWIMSQTVFASDALAVTVALFIYTMAGLISYSYGRTTTSSTWRQIGILLLSTVILRLALVDFWGMESKWKIVTFLGIGFLFIVTALLERSRDEQVIKEDIISE